jgi:ubiquinone/menaquinone biosynthesis C-methylase UbiE
MPRSSFDALAEDYDAARPSYPDDLYQALEQAAGLLDGKLVLDAGAGTGIATRQLAARGARTVAFDLAEQMLRRALARSPGSCCLLADGSAMPFRDGSFDFVCFAQSWHWFDPAAAAHESARVLRPGGYWAAWWNQASAQGQDWFAAYQDTLESACPDYRRNHDRDQDWSREAIAETGLFEPGALITVPWTRVLRVELWLTEDRSKSYVGALDPGARVKLLAQIAEIIRPRFPGGQMSVPYRTRLALARRRLTAPPTNQRRAGACAQAA